MASANGGATGRDDAGETGAEGGVDAHGFADDGVEVGEFGDAGGVAEGVGQCSVLEGGVDFVEEFGKGMRVAVEVVEDGGQGYGCRVAPCPDDGPELGGDVFDGPAGSGVGGGCVVDEVEEAGEHVVAGFVFAGGHVVEAFFDCDVGLLDYVEEAFGAGTGGGVDHLREEV